MSQTSVIKNAMITMSKLNVTIGKQRARNNILEADKLEETRGKILIYSNFEGDYGIKTLKRVFDYMGYQETIDQEVIF